jgi:SagB-type dehydrogenase family enzyme
MANDDGFAARRFHEATKHSAVSLRREPHRLDWGNLPLGFKIYRTIAGEPLPEPKASGISTLDAIHGRGPRRAAGERPDRQGLARLLRYSFGVLRRGRVGDGHWRDFRAAPNTGALYHVDAYLVSADLGDLRAGVYHFGPHDFSLRRLREGDWRGVVADAAGAESSVANAPVTIVLASTYWRNAWKYRLRAYRHVFWDGGTAIAQLLAEASAGGWPARLLVGFADRPIEALCALDGDREGIVALVTIGDGMPAPEPPLAAPLRFETERLSPEEVDYPEIRAVHSAGILDDGAEASCWRARAAPAVTDARSGETVRLAPESVRSEESLEAVIERRGSTRVFETSAISAADLSSILDAATAPLEADYRASPDRALVDLFVLIHAVEGVEPGAYRWHGAEHALERVWTGQRRRETGYLALGQALAAMASACAFAIADLDEVLSRFGTRGYRASTLDGGISGGRAYLAAYACRLGATGLTFFDDDAVRFFGLDPTRQGVMFLTAIGRPAHRSSR